MKAVKLDLQGSGLGDIFMGLAAAHALRDAGYIVYISAVSDFHEIIRKCPHVYHVGTDDTGGTLSTAWHHLQTRHQVDENIALFGIDPTTVDNNSKSIDLYIEPELLDNVKRIFPNKNRIVVCPGCSAKTRRWPKENWQELVTRFNADGIDVVSSGMTTYPWVNEHGSDKLEGVIEAFNLSTIETIALYSQSKVVISTDSAPIQLAGATDCGILGLYSVINPESRLPYRHGELGWNAYGITTKCKQAGCYHKIVKEGEFNTWSNMACALFFTNHSLTQIIDNWCLENSNEFQCMSMISVDEVYNKAIEMYNKQE